MRKVAIWLDKLGAYLDNDDFRNWYRNYQDNKETTFKIVNKKTDLYMKFIKTIYKNHKITKGSVKEVISGGYQYFEQHIHVEHDQYRIYYSMALTLTHNEDAKYITPNRPLRLCWMIMYFDGTYNQSKFFESVEVPATIPDLKMKDIENALTGLKQSLEKKDVI